MGRGLRSALRETSGAVAIEFAIGFIPLLILLFGGITYSGVLATVIALEHAASEGARAGIAGLTVCERKTHAEAVASDALLFGSLSNTAAINATVTEQQIRVDIDVDYADNPLTPAIFPVPENLNASVVVLTDGPELTAASC